MKTINELDKLFQAQNGFSQLCSLEAQIPDSEPDIIEETNKWIMENIPEEYWPTNLKN